MLRYQVTITTTDKIIVESFNSQTKCDAFVADFIKEHAFKDLVSINYNTYNLHE